MAGIVYPYVLAHGETIVAAQLDANFNALAAKLASLAKSDFRSSAAFQNNMKACQYSVAPFSLSLDSITLEGSGGGNRYILGALGFNPNKVPDGVAQGNSNAIKEIHVVNFGLYVLAQAGYVSGDTFKARLNYTDTDGLAAYVESQHSVNTPALTNVSKWVTDFSVDLRIDTAAGGSARSYYGVELIVWTEMLHLR